MNAEQTNLNLELNRELNLEVKGKGKPKPKAKAPKNIASTVNSTIAEKEEVVTDEVVTEEVVTEEVVTEEKGWQNLSLHVAGNDVPLIGYLKFAHFVLHNPDKNFLLNLLSLSPLLIHNTVFDVIHYGNQHTIINYMRTLCLKQKSVADTIVDELVTLARTEPDVVAPIAKKSRAKKVVAEPEVIDGAEVISEPIVVVISEPVVEADNTEAKPVVVKKPRAKKTVVETQVETQVIAELTVDLYEPVEYNPDILVGDNVELVEVAKKPIVDAVTVDDAVEIDAKPAKKTNAKPRSKKAVEEPADIKIV